MTERQTSSLEAPRSSRLLVLSILAVAAVLVVAACGGSSTSTATQSSASTKPAYCSDLTSLQASVKALGEVKVVQNGTQALKSAFSKVKTDAQALEASVKGEFTTQVTAVKDSIDQLTATVKELGSSPSSATVSKVKAQVAATSTSVKNLAGSASAKCG